ncbi:MAG: general secretion pathway protein C [Ramlibacter sp.]|nr:general secretion pathway protein C [Ramlibacter sp.]
MQGKWLVQVCAALVWALAAAAAVGWGLRLWPAPSQPEVAPVAPTVAVPQSAAVAQLLGGAATGAAVVAVAPSVARHVLVGVVAGQRGGAALISTDGKPARPYRVGATVEEGLVLKAVSARGAQLAPTADAPVSQTLELQRRSGPGNVNLPVPAVPAPAMPCTDSPGAVPCKPVPQRPRPPQPA